MSTPRSADLAALAEVLADYRHAEAEWRRACAEGRDAAAGFAADHGDALEQIAHRFAEAAAPLVEEPADNPSPGHRIPVTEEQVALARIEVQAFTSAGLTPDPEVVRMAHAKGSTPWEPTRHRTPGPVQ